MVFKVKQKAKKDYKIYKNKQIASAVLAKARQINVSEDVRIGVYGQLDGHASKKIESLEVFGANWPYDYFSLIESIKLDIEIEVQD